MIANEDYFRTIFETASEGVWITNAQGSTTLVNPRMREILGYPAEEMLGRSYLDFVHPDETQRANQDRKSVV